MVLAYADLSLCSSAFLIMVSCWSRESVEFNIVDFAKLPGKSLKDIESLLRLALL